MVEKTPSFEHVKVENLPDRVRQPYDLTRNFVRHKFSPEENRILIRILQRVKVYQSINYSPKLNSNRRVGMRFHWRELLLPNQNSKNRLEESLKLLREKSVFIKSLMQINGNLEPSIIGSGVISRYQYDTVKTFVDIEIESEWYDYIKDLSMGYTEFDSKTSYRLSSSYSIKLYYFCCHWLEKGGLTLTVDQFKKEFDINENIYMSKTASRFKEKILDPGKKALDASADVSFNYTEIRSGRKITGFVFKFYKTKNYKTYTGFEIDRVGEIFNRLEKEFSFVLTKKDKARISGICKKYSYTVIRSILSIYSMDIIEYVSNRVNIADAISKCINENIAFTVDSNKIKNQ